MEVEITHKVDASEKGKDGKYDYYYEYDLYTFKDKNITIIARSYTTESDEIHFLRAVQNEKHRPISKADLKLPIFNEIIPYLKNINKIKINWLSNSGYISVE